MTTLVLYYFQGDPGESLEFPNAFQISSGGKVTFGQFLAQFPKAANTGSLHFRFRLEDATHGFIWVDLKSPNDVLPLSSAGIITCKILRLDDSSAIKRYTRLKKKALLDRGDDGAAVFRALSTLTTKSKDSITRPGARETAPTEIESEEDEEEDRIQDQRYVEAVNGNNKSAVRTPASRPISKPANNSASSQAAPKTASPATAPVTATAPAPAPTAVQSVNLLGEQEEEEGRQEEENEGDVNDPVTTADLLQQDTPPLSEEETSAKKVTQTKNRSPISPIPPIPGSTSSQSSTSTSTLAPAAPPAPAVDTAPAPIEADMFHFDSPAPKRNSNAGGVGSAGGGSGGMDGDLRASGKGTNGLTREQLAANREAAIDQKVKVALEFKQELDETQKREGEELDQAKAKHEYKLNNWASNNKEKRNVRTLLSTMHTVLWADNRWKPIGLGDVLQPSQVKLQYRKAMLVVHPDRCSHLDVETKFIAKRVFEAINEAYQEFLKKESV